MQKKKIVFIFCNCAGFCNKEKVLVKIHYYYKENVLVLMEDKKITRTLLYNYCYAHDQFFSVYMICIFI